MVKVLADENIFPAIVNFLRQKGLDVVSVQEKGLTGATDDEVFEIAQKEQRALITFDRHFANILRYPPSKHCGIIVIRIHPPLLSIVLAALEGFLQKFDLTTLCGALIILRENGFRVRRTP
ncbi:DUF5615 family PIN-like protein [Fervidibacter sacchari]|uniref:Nuclease of putative toxin-antitoxin system n=1 Tax=Candidatus Fervidibacter sacchari TaxID=1448929 RepID=A0ABT2EI95_9BACT|nr:DUF5615 family PIN-like protein [Candidatus Fervidibacter sacchari]MCS3917669.1 putative nuclease of putative toxin-antitoxin system [Candidatus Fervidibacter sacchari]WKU15499.1 DUF5615 family PIN-like protein [Candidatus Fervidibacter sacchari]